MINKILSTLFPVVAEVKTLRAELVQKTNEISDLKNKLFVTETSYESRLKIAEKKHQQEIQELKANLVNNYQAVKAGTLPLSKILDNRDVQKTMTKPDGKSFMQDSSFSQVTSMTDTYDDRACHPTPDNSSSSSPSSWGSCSSSDSSSSSGSCGSSD